MNWEDFDWKKVANTVGKIAPAIGTVIGGPAGGAVGGAISILTNALGVDETPDAVMQALQNDPEAYRKIKQAELDHELELQKLVYQTTQAGYQREADIIDSLSTADASGHSTRPKIALELSRAFLFVYILIGCAMAWAIYSGGMKLSDSWMALTAYLGIPMTVIKMYFGDLRKEHAQSQGQQVDFGILGSLLGSKK